MLFYVVLVCKCVLPPGDNPIAINKYYYYYYYLLKIKLHIISAIKRCIFTVKAALNSLVYVRIIAFACVIGDPKE